MVNCFLIHQSYQAKPLNQLGISPRALIIVRTV